MRPPKNHKEVQKILGHVTFIRHLLPLRASHLVSKFSHLASSKTEFRWSNECQSAFQELKEIIASDKVYIYAPISTHPSTAENILLELVLSDF